MHSLICRSLAFDSFGIVYVTGIPARKFQLPYRIAVLIKQLCKLVQEIAPSRVLSEVFDKRCDISLLYTGRRQRNNNFDFLEFGHCVSPIAACVPLRVAFAPAAKPRALVIS